MRKTDVTINTLESRDLIELKLANAGFERTGYFVCEDIYFTNIPNKLVKATKYNDLINTSVIVRSIYEDVVGIQKSYLVHKHKYFNKFNQVLSEEVSTTKISSATEMLYILRTANFTNWISFQQQKYFYKKGEIVLSLSFVEGLDGAFINMKEVPTIKDLPKPKKFKFLCQLVDTLGITHSPDYSCKKSYMLYEQMRKHKGTFKG